MGQKKVKKIDLDAKDAKKKNAKTQKKSAKSAENPPKPKASEDKEKTKAEEKKVEKKPKKKLRSKRYRKLRTYIDRQKFYSPKKAVKLLCKIANSKIDETVKVDIVSRRKDARGKVKLVHKKKPVEFETEKKASLLHVVIGKISLGEKKLLVNLEELVSAVGPKSIKKAVLSATHSPGIKLEIDKE